MSSDDELSREELVEFYDARDLFLGSGNALMRRDMDEGLRRLRASRHPEARFVCSLFPEGAPESEEKAKEALLGHSESPVALCFAGAVAGNQEDLLRRAAERGHPFAMGAMIFFSSDAERVEWARRATAAGDRVGWFMLGTFLWDGEGCETDRAKALATFEQAAQLGDAGGMAMFGGLAFGEDDPARYLWTGRACRVSGSWRGFMNWTGQNLRLHDEGRGRAAVLLMIGRMLKGYEDGVDERDRDVATRAVSMFDECITRAREAVMCWMLCARRLGLYKDVSLIVARNVWEGREAFFEKK